MTILLKKSCLPALVLTSVFMASCERSEPTIILKNPYGREAVVSYDDVKGQPRFVKYKKSPYMRRKIAEMKEKERERQRGRYPRASRWDY